MIEMTVLKELVAESLGELFESVKEIRIEDINVEELDKPVDLELPRRNQRGLKRGRVH